MNIDRNSLAAALTAARTVVPTRSPRRILQQALLREVDGCPILSATDLERGLDIVLTGDAAKGEQIMLPIAEAGAALGTISDDTVSVTKADTGRTTLKSPTARWTWEAEPAEEAPKGPDSDKSGGVSIPGARLAEALGRVAWSVGEPTRYALHRTHLLAKNGHITVTTTSGKTLAQDSFAAEGARDSEALVDAHSCLALLEALGNPATIAMGVSPTFVEFRAVDGSRAWALSSNFPFPPYDGIIPDVRKLEPAHLSAKALLAAVKRVNLVTVKESRSVKLTFADGAVLVSTENGVMSGDGGRIPFAGVAQPEVNLDGGFLAAAISGVEGELSVWTHERGPTTFQAASREGWLALVMPVVVG